MLIGYNMQMWVLKGLLQGNYSQLFVSIGCRSKYAAIVLNTSIIRQVILHGSKQIPSLVHLVS